MESRVREKDSLSQLIARGCNSLFPPLLSVSVSWRKDDASNDCRQSVRLISKNQVQDVITHLHFFNISSQYKILTESINIF